MTTEVKVDACLPFYNNALTIKKAVESVHLQTHPVRRLFLINDASTDDGREQALELSSDIIDMPANSGRGAVRARAIEESQGEFLLSCDATNALDPDFLAKALHWFDDSSVAAVFGRIIDPEPRDVVDRWRARHLFLQDAKPRANEGASLCTWAFLCRVKHIKDIGNFQTNLRHSEDVEIGHRLLDAGYKVVFDPACIARPLVRNTISECLERHWRWYVARGGPMDAATLKRWVGLAWGSMVTKDLKAGDPLAAMISLWLPAHHWLKSIK